MVDMCVDACIVSEDPTALDYIVCSTTESGVEPTVMGGLPTSGFLLFLLINAETVEDNKGTFSSEKSFNVSRIPVPLLCQDTLTPAKILCMPLLAGSFIKGPTGAQNLSVQSWP